MKRAVQIRRTIHQNKRSVCHEKALTLILTFKNNMEI